MCIKKIPRCISVSEVVAAVLEPVPSPKPKSEPPTSILKKSTSTKQLKRLPPKVALPRNSTPTEVWTVHMGS